MEQIVATLQQLLLFVAIIWGISAIVGLFKPSKHRQKRANRAARRQEQAKFEASQYAQTTSRSFAEINSDDGMLGEYLLSEEIAMALPGYRLLFNLYVPTADGKTSEVDVVLVHETGIYVFESKYYAGWIFGSDGDRFWTQTFRTTRNRFPNPILQNEGHVRALQAYLGLKRSAFMSVVVFGDNCKLKKIEVTSAPVLQTNRIAPFMIGLIGSRKAVLTPTECQAAFSKLEQVSHATDELKNAHIARLRATYGADGHSAQPQASAVG